MYEILEKTRDTARVSDCDPSQALSVTPDASSTIHGQSVPDQKSRHLRVPTALSASNPAECVAYAFPPAKMVLVVESWSESFLSPSEADFARTLREGLAELPEPIRESAAAKLCRRFGDGTGLTLAQQPDTRVAVFEDEDGMVTLVAHHRPKRRQVSFEFHTDGRTIGIVSIDEHMQRTERECTLGEAEVLRNAIAWLSS